MCKNIKILIDEKTLYNRITELASQISNDYKNQELILICILKGSIFFTTDIAKKLDLENVIIDFMKISSYGNGARESSRKY